MPKILALLRVICSVDLTSLGWFILYSKLCYDASPHTVTFSISYSSPSHKAFSLTFKLLLTIKCSHYSVKQHRFFCIFCDENPCKPKSAWGKWPEPPLLYPSTSPIKVSQEYYKVLEDAIWRSIILIALWRTYLMPRKDKHCAFCRSIGCV